MRDQAVLSAESREVTYRGEVIEVTPLRVGQIPKFLQAIRPAQAALAGAMDGAGEELDLVALLGDHGEAVIAATAVAVRRPQAFIEEGTLDELLPLAKAVFEVNLDFFVTRVAPQLASLVAARAAPSGESANGGGPTASRN